MLVDYKCAGLYYCVPINPRYRFVGAFVELNNVGGRQSLRKDPAQWLAVSTSQYSLVKLFTDKTSVSVMTMLLHVETVICFTLHQSIVCECEGATKAQY